MFRSNDYQDELAWSAIWLYQATGEASYLADAEANRVAGPGWGDSWDDKITYTNVGVVYCQRLAHRNLLVSCHVRDWPIEICWCHAENF